VTDWIAIAEKHGAKFEQRGPDWWASAYRRGRALPLFSVIAHTKERAAQMFCEQIHLKERK